jgi:hypothetical protein
MGGNLSSTLLTPSIETAPARIPDDQRRDFARAWSSSSVERLNCPERGPPAGLLSVP